MSADIMIRAEGLGKCYLIGHQTQRERYTTLRDVIVRTAVGISRSVVSFAHGDAVVPGDEVEEFWALKDVNFEVARGEVVGVIGRNGAGKSTLLKVLSRITEPSEGRIEIRGRVASLLEVGTGFHPELTGRENIFLNGSILGMTRSEIKRKFDEIVAFAEVDKFLDTPVKRYSSGMYVRLAFAVAAHLEPEILIVDEVLAVGDAAFQKKCLDKMQDVAGQGRTVLFVSHNMAAVQALCSRGIVMSKGGIICSGSVTAAIDRYLVIKEPAYAVTFAGDARKPAIAGVRVDHEALRMCDLVLEIDFVSPQPLGTPVGGIVLSTARGEPVWGSNCRFHKYIGQGKNVSRGVLRCEARQLPLVPGNYTISVWLGEWYEDHDAKLDALTISFGEEVEDSLCPPASVRGHLDWPAVWRSEPLKVSPPVEETSG